MRDSARPLTAEGIWLRITARPDGEPRPGLFLDRDGVIVEDVGYLRRAADVRLIPGAADIIRRANIAGLPVAVVTNQSGISRGRFGWDDFATVEDRIAALLAAEGAAVDAVAACPFHPSFTPDYGDSHARWRKPGPAMLTATAAALKLDLARCWMIGDKTSDIEAADNAGLAGAIWVTKGRRGGQTGPAGADFIAAAAADLFGAAEILDRELAALRR